MCNWIELLASVGRQASHSTISTTDRSFIRPYLGPRQQVGTLLAQALGLGARRHFPLARLVHLPAELVDLFWKGGKQV